MQDISERKAVRSAAILTNTYVAGTTLDNVGKYNQLILLIKFTIGSLTDARVKVDQVEGTDDYQLSVGAVSAGVTTVSQNEYKLSASGNYAVPVQVKAGKLKISALGTGTVTNSSMAIEAVLAVA